VTNTLVIDVGTTIVGVYSVESAQYVGYYGAARHEAVQLIQAASEVVTYNGARYDLLELGRIAGLPGNGPLPLRGEHSDMQEICWPGILGSSLKNTFARLVGSCPTFPETYEDSNQRDIHMTLKLWELWRAGQLTDIHGRPIRPHAA
jgi:hypothetical protein